MFFWLSVERGVVVSRPTICRVLKRNKWTQKNIASLSLSRSEALRKAYIEEMKKYAADDLVFNLTSASLRGPPTFAARW